MKENETIYNTIVVNNTDLINMLAFPSKAEGKQSNPNHRAELDGAVPRCPNLVKSGYDRVQITFFPVNQVHFIEFQIKIQISVFLRNCMS